MAKFRYNVVELTVKGTRKVNKAVKAINRLAKATEKATSALQKLKVEINANIGQENENVETRD